MSQFEGILTEKISFLTADQQERVLKFVEDMESKEPSDTLGIQLWFEPFEIRCVAKYREKVISYSTGSLKDEDLVQNFCHYVREHHHLLIGRSTAQHTIDEIGSIYPFTQERTLHLKGRNIDNGLPASTEISSIEVREQIAPPIQSQIHQLMVNFQFLPHRLKEPEDILVGATVRLVGRYGNIRGLAEAVQQATGLTVVD